MNPTIQIENVHKVYDLGEVKVEALRGVSFTISPGEFVSIMGQSGSGKSTLMNILGCLDRPTEGTYLFAGKDISKLDPDELAELRREHFGFIFQRYQLLADLDATENAAMPAIYAGVDTGARTRRARDLLTRL